MAIAVHEPNKPENYFAWQPDHRRHLSVGAVVENGEGLILTVYLDRVDAKYFLPTATHSPNKTLEETLLKVEQKIGWKLEIQKFLGVTNGEFPVPEGSNVTKDVIWLKCKAVEPLTRDAEDRDADSEMQWKCKDELNEIFAKQSEISSDVDQRRVLELLS